MQQSPILIVDDDAMTRLILRTYIERHGLPAAEAENGQRAIELLENNPGIQQVVLDLNMPVLDGFHFLQQYTQCMPGRELYIYIASAYSLKQFMTRVREDAIPIGHVVDYLEKPFHMSTLLAHILAPKELTTAGNLRFHDSAD